MHISIPHRPEHKETCGKEDVLTLIPKLVRTLFANNLLSLHLQSCFVLAFDLAQRRRRDDLLLARLDVAVEPSSIANFGDIFLEQRSTKKEVPGMLQLNAFVLPPKPLDSSSDPQVSHMRGLWRSKFALAEAEGAHGCAVGMVAVSHPETELAMTIPFRILPS
ncbi:hypothetical protein C8R45DRAFT_1147664 [Mycena sanguinolenta]|nr:hypothetical protein C8R45DRAFT_1147664 [Mycena sanguinolenta]